MKLDPRDTILSKKCYFEVKIDIFDESKIKLKVFPIRYIKFEAF